MGDKQPDSDPCPSFKISHSVGLRLPTLSSQGEVLHLNPKKANQYVLIIKYEFTYTHCNTQTSLDKHVRAWLRLILRPTQPIFVKKLGGKQRGTLANT